MAGNDQKKRQQRPQEQRDRLFRENNRLPSRPSQPRAGQQKRDGLQDPDPIIVAKKLKQ